MYASRLFQLLLLAVAVVCVAQAAYPRPLRYGRDLHSRQDIGDDDLPSDGTDGSTGDDGDDSTIPTPDPLPSPIETSTSEFSSSSTPSPTPTPSPDESTTTPPVESTTSSSSTPEETPTTSSSSSTEDQTSSTPSTTRAPQQSTSSTPDSPPTTSQSISISTQVDVVTRTNGDGSRETRTTTSETTFTPGLNTDNSSDDDGMSDGTRNTIIGVVVGVGGAVLLGALGIVWWRIWGRKKQNEENHGLMDYDESFSPRPETSEPGSTPAGTMTGSHSSPFTTNLESYHQPANVNASSNF